MKEHSLKAPFYLIIPSLMGLAFFYSGFFLFLTPLVYAYVFTRRGPQHFSVNLAVSFVVVVLVAAVLMPKFHALYESSPHWGWLFPIPAMDYLPRLGHFGAALLSVLYFCSMALMSLAVGYSLQVKSLFHYVVKISLYGLMILGALFLVFLHFKQWQVGAVFGDYYGETLGEFLKIQEQAGLPQDQIGYLKEYTPHIVKLMTVLTPGFVFIVLLGIILLNVVLLRRLFAVMGILPLRGIISDWTVPFSGVWVVISALIFFVGSIYNVTVPYLVPIAINILFIMGFLYYIQGLGVVFYYFEKRGASFLIKMLFYSFLLLLFQVSTVVLISTGFFDSWFDFRKMDKK